MTYPHYPKRCFTDTRNRIKPGAIDEAIGERQPQWLEGKYERRRAFFSENAEREVTRFETMCPAMRAAIDSFDALGLDLSTDGRNGALHAILNGKPAVYTTAGHHNQAALIARDCIHAGQEVPASIWAKASKAIMPLNGAGSRLISNLDLSLTKEAAE
ncbi:MAG: hypothetical protein AB7F96_22730 [Beijerinckiaceae bacterium]